VKFEEITNLRWLGSGAQGARGGSRCEESEKSERNKHQASEETKPP